MKYLVPALLIIFLSCSQRNNNRPDPGSKSSSADISCNVCYANSFRLEESDHYTRVTVFNPWQKASNIEYKYLLSDKPGQIPDSVSGERINIPVKSVVCLSTTHIAMIDFVGGINTIAGISGPDYISNQTVRDKIAANQIIDVGFDENINYEAILSIQPDVVFMYDVTGGTQKAANKLKELGIQVVYIADYLEQSPLGKMEWVKFISLFYGTFRETSDRFNQVAHNYHMLSAKVENIHNKPVVMIGLPWKGTWYVSGNNTYAARIIQDAGGKYLWHDFVSDESEPISLEVIFQKAVNADFWLNTGFADSYHAVLEVDERFKSLKSFVNRKLYNNSKRMNDTGGNDYWESGIVCPDVILKDLIKILHPGVLPDHELVYYRKLEE